MAFQPPSDGIPLGCLDAVIEKQADFGLSGQIAGQAVEIVEDQVEPAGQADGYADGQAGE
jgi:hypothetical protein